MPKPKKKEIKKKAAPVLKVGSAQVRQITALLEQDKNWEAANLAMQAMERYPNQPEIAELAVEALMEDRRTREALIPVRRLLDLTPNRMRPLYMAAVIYSANDMYAHAVRCIRRMKEINPNYEGIERLAKLESTGNEYLQKVAETMNVSFEDLEEGTFHLEEANVYRNQQDYPSAVEHLRRAAELLPSSEPILNFLAEAIFLTGHLDEAETLSNRVLELDPKNVEAGLRLMFIARARYDDAALQAIYNRVKVFDPGDSMADQIRMGKIHGLMGEDEKAYAAARPAADQPSLPPAALYVLASAAANTGRIQEAKGYHRLQMQQGLFGITLFLDLLDAGLPGPGMTNAFSYVDDSELMDVTRFREIMSPLWHARDMNSPVPKAALEGVTEQFPQIVWIGEKLLFEDDLDAGMALLLSLRNDRATGMVRDLAASRTAPWRARLTAATALIEHDYVPEGEKITVWQDDHPHEIGKEEIDALFRESLTDEEIKEEIWDAIDVARQQPKESERLLRELLAKHPDVPQALHNLSLLVSDPKEAESLLQHALELQPDYDYARATLAALHASQSRPDEAEAVLAEIPADRLLKPSDYVAILYARAYIDRARQNYDEALSKLKKVFLEDIFHQAAWDLRDQIEALKGHKTSRPSRSDENWAVPDRLLTRGVEE
jgi:tetratricopeptide (TPR) repeat protein